MQTIELNSMLSRLPFSAKNWLPANTLQFIDAKGLKKGSYILYEDRDSVNELQAKI
jgi:hypothetical protein